MLSVLYVTYVSRACQGAVCPAAGYLGPSKWLWFERACRWHRILILPHGPTTALSFSLSIRLLAPNNDVIESLSDEWAIRVFLVLLHTEQWALQFAVWMNCIGDLVSLDRMILHYTYHWSAGSPSSRQKQLMPPKLTGIKNSYCTYRSTTLEAQLTHSTQGSKSIRLKLSGFVSRLPCPVLRSALSVRRSVQLKSSNVCSALSITRVGNFPTSSSDRSNQSSSSFSSERCEARTVRFHAHRTNLSWDQDAQR